MWFWRFVKFYTFYISSLSHVHTSLFYLKERGGRLEAWKRKKAFTIEDAIIFGKSPHRFFDGLNDALHAFNDMLASTFCLIHYRDYAISQNSTRTAFYYAISQIPLRSAFFNVLLHNIQLSLFLKISVGQL